MSRSSRGKVAEYYVAAELTRRGYLIAMPPGNVAGTDLFVESPEGAVFGVEVKSLKKPNFWLVKDSPVESSRFYILVLLNEPSPRYFVFTPGQMLKEKDVHRAKVQKRGKPTNNPLWQGINMGQVYPYENQWDILPP
ncbi:MAG: hypothetical protein JRC92_07750 [Deltaproteobacteria bacterium]|nr:hypothetical protein [Deltaproteobacteria bacterium]